MKNILRLPFFLLVFVLYLPLNSYGQTDTTTFIPCSSGLLETPEQDSTSNGFAPNNALWEPGRTLRVGFIGGTSFIHEKVIRYAKEWEQYANITFQFVSSGNTEIRITFAARGHYSYVGTGALRRSQNLETMNLQFNNNTPESEFRRVTQHEFGHALGLLHEHQHPESNIQWNRVAVYNYFARCHGWSRNVVDNNILNTVPSAGHFHCSYDPASIMHYPVQNELTLNNFSVGNNTVLSNEDKSFMRLLYPADGNRENAECGFCAEDCGGNDLRVNITGLGSVSINPTEGNTTSCSSSCTRQFTNSQIVNVTATPATGYRFVRWQGTTCNNSATSNCQLLMNSNHTMTAVFEPVEVEDHDLNIDITGSGNIRVITNTNQTCNNDCNISFPNQTAISLEANAATGYRFVRWEGDRCNNSVDANCSFTLNRDLSLKAIFEQEASSNNTLSINVNGNGSVVTTVNNNANTCTDGCTYTFSQNSTTRVRAVPANGFRFVRWEGSYCNTNSNSSCNFVLSSNSTMTAIFESEVTQGCLTLELDPRVVSCNTGLVFIDISNGTAPYNISLSGPVSGDGRTNSASFAIPDLNAGQYTLTIRDANNCTATQSFSIANTCGSLVGGGVGNSVFSPSTTSFNIESQITAAKLLIKSFLQVAPNYPNPFVNDTQLPIQLTVPRQFNLEIVHINGQKVYQQHYDLGAGKHLLTLNSQIFPSSGIYIYHLSFENQMITGKMVKL